VLDSGGNVHVVAINKSTAPQVVTFSIPGYVSAVGALLTAPAFDSTSGITIGGQTFDGSTNGAIQGKHLQYPVTVGKGAFTVTVPAISAVILTASK